MKTYVASIGGKADWRFAPRMTIKRARSSRPMKAVVEYIIEELQVLCTQVVSSFFRLSIWKWRVAAEPLLHVLPTPLDYVRQ
jgi:hypothetical protein